MYFHLISIKPRMTDLDPLLSDPPQNTSVSVDPSGPVPDGSSVTLTCTSVANPAAANFSWFRVAGGEKELISSERDFTFNVTKLSHDQYVCKALNVHGDDDSELISIDVTCEDHLSVVEFKHLLFQTSLTKHAQKGQLSSVSQLLHRFCLLHAVSALVP